MTILTIYMYLYLNKLYKEGTKTISLNEIETLYYSLLEIEDLQRFKQLKSFDTFYREFVYVFSYFEMGLYLKNEMTFVDPLFFNYFLKCKVVDDSVLNFIDDTYAKTLTKNER